MDENSELTRLIILMVVISIPVFIAMGIKLYPRWKSGYTKYVEHLKKFSSKEQDSENKEAKDGKETL